MPEESFLSSLLYQEAVEEIRFRMEGASERNIALFGQTWFSKHFTMAENARTESSFSSILGQLHAAPAASTINQFSARPIRSLEGFGKKAYEMLTAAHTYKLEAEDLRDIAQFMRMWPAAKDRQKVLNYIINKLMNVREKAIKGVQEHIDIRTLTLLSNDGKFLFTETNDPGSPYIGTEIDFGFDPDHAAKVATASDKWTDANASTVNVLEDLLAICDQAEGNGYSFEKILLRREQLMYMLTTAKLKLYINGTDNASKPITLDDINTFFAKYDIPPFEVVRHISETEAKGGKVRNRFQPWKEGKLLFVPSNNFGTIEHLMTDADLIGKDKGVDYAKYNHIEVTNWEQGIKENTNHTEFVSACLTYSPVVDTIKDMWSLDVLTSKA